MNISQNGINLLKQFEGFSKTSYPDSGGIYTIGYGNITYKNGTAVKKGETITEVQASDLLLYFVNKFTAKILPFIKVNLNQNQFDALVIFAYNVGVSAFSKSTLIKVINENPNDKVGISEQFLRWNKVGGVPVKGLTNRRQKEIDLYFS